MSTGIRVKDIGILMLAAGRSRRFEGDKRQARMSGGLSLLDVSLRNIPDSIQHRTLVLRPGDEEMAHLYTEAGWSVCLAPLVEQGMGHSLAAGIHAVRDWPGVIIALADMPWVRPDTYRALQAGLATHDIVVPVMGGRRGNPVAFRQHYFPELLRMTGDQGARGLLQKHAEHCFELACEDAGILRDVDRPEDLPDSQKF